MDESAHRLKLIESVLRLPAELLPAASDCLRKLQNTAPSAAAAGPHEQSPNANKAWPHAPRHCLSEQGTYMVTTGTYHKAHIFCDADRLTCLESSLLALAREYDWELEAWAVFSNHYHFVGHTLSTPPDVRYVSEDTYQERIAGTERMPRSRSSLAR